MIRIKFIKARMINLLWTTKEIPHGSHISYDVLAITASCQQVSIILANQQLYVPNRYLKGSGGNMGEKFLSFVKVHITVVIAGKEGPL